MDIKLQFAKDLHFSKEQLIYSKSTQLTATCSGLPKGQLFFSSCRRTAVHRLAQVDHSVGVAVCRRGLYKGVVENEMLNAESCVKVPLGF